MREPISQIQSFPSMDIHTLTWQGDAGPPTLLLHGFLDLAWSWTWFVQAWGSSRTLVAPDFRGHGESGRPPKGSSYAFHQYIGDLHDLHRSLTSEPIDIVAHSMGGVVATYYAGAFPELVRRLVLLEGLGPPDTPLDQAPKRLRTWARTHTEHRNPRQLKSQAEAAQRLRARNPRLSQEQAEFLAQKGTTATGEGVIWKHDPRHLGRNAVPYTLDYHRPFLQAIDCPVLMVNGADSQFVMPDRSTREALLAKGRVEVLADAGHMLHHDQPQALAELVDGFLNQ